VNYAEPQLLQLSVVEWNNWGQKIITANCNCGGGDKRAGTLLSFAAVSYPKPVSLSSQGRLFSAQGSVAWGWADRSSLPTFPGENLLLLHWPLWKKGLDIFWRAMLSPKCQ